MVVLLLTRTLSQADVGIVLAALAAAVLGELAATQGRDAVAIQVIPQALAADDPARANAFVRSLARQLAWGVPVAGVAAALATAALTGGAASILALALTALLVAGMTALRALSQLVIATGSVATGTTLLFAVRPALWFGGVAALRTAGVLTVETALAAAAVAASLAAAAQALVARRRLGFLRAPPAPADPAWGRSGRQLILPGLMIGELPNVVTLCAGAVLAAPQIALLGVALRVMGLVALGTRSLIAAVGPRVSAAWGQGGARGAERVARWVPRLAAPATLTVAAGVWVFAEPLLGVFGEGYEASAWTLRVLVLAPLATACAGPSLMLLTVAGHAREGGRAAWFAAPALAAGATVGALFGTLGAAVGVLGAVVFWETLLVRRLSRAAGVSIWLPLVRRDGRASRAAPPPPRRPRTRTGSPPAGSA